MQFKPMSKNELKTILSEGNYDFQVIAAEERISSAGNPMIQINIKVGNVFITDWLMQPVSGDDIEKVKNKIWKIRAFCYSTGLTDRYEAGNLTANDCISKKGIAKIKIRKDKNNEDINSVAAYLETKPATDSYKALSTNDHAIQTHKDTFIDDDLPF